jgi:hypothetical protein
LAQSKVASAATFAAIVGFLCAGVFVAVRYPDGLKMDDLLGVGTSQRSKLCPEIPANRQASCKVSDQGEFYILTSGDGRWIVLTKDGKVLQTSRMP